MRTCKHLLIGWPAAVLLALATGCAEHEATVSGRVTLDGKPLDHGAVTFHPANPGAAAYGSISAGGNYVVKTGRGKGLAAGPYVVTVQAVTMESLREMKTDASGAPVESTGTLLTPPQYANRDASPLRVEVKPGSNSIDLELKSSP